MCAEKKNGPPAKEKQKASAAPQTVTCRHCRYERPAEGKQCPLCGYPWPWLKNS